VADEIRLLSEKNGIKWDGKKIAVIQGSVHTPTYHNFKKKFPHQNVKREMPTSQYFYPSPTAIERALGIKPDRVISETDYIRAMLTEFLIAKDLIPVFKDGLSAVNEASRITTTMSDQEIENYWKKICDHSVSLKNDPQNNTLVAPKLIYALNLLEISNDLVKRASLPSK
jgi:hypothetical protein